ncbi:MAG TPA: DUF4012 domain-containing protein [bacterium]|nr:DUF4012 domain-containing protein [bacterium]
MTQKGRKFIDGIVQWKPEKIKRQKEQSSLSFFAVVKKIFIKNINNWQRKINGWLVPVKRKKIIRELQIKPKTMEVSRNPEWGKISVAIQHSLSQTKAIFSIWCEREVIGRLSMAKKNIFDSGVRNAWLKKIRIMVYVGLILILAGGGWIVSTKLFSIKDSVVLAAGNGIGDMKDGVDRLKLEEFDEAAKRFADAEEQFSTINSQIVKMGQTDNFLSSSSVSGDYLEMVKTADGLSHLARGSKYLSLAVAELAGNKEDGGFSSLFFGILKGQIQEDMFLGMDKAAQYFNMSQSELTTAVDSFQNIDESLIPNDYRGVYGDVMENAPKYLEMMKGVNALLDKSGIFLGKNVPAKYLLLFQNTNEMRATGGFIGSYGILTMDGGRLESIKFDDVYNPDGQLLKKIDPPYPISLMTDQWGMRDSNWDPDFPVSADQAVRMFERAGGYSVDGVVAFTPAIVENFLQLTGPIEMPEYGITLDAGNFKSEVQEEVELNADDTTGSPKKILADLLPILMDKMMNLDKDVQNDFWKTMLTMIEEKSIMFFAYNTDVQKLFEEIGWAGEVKQVEQNEDYLYMVHSNIGGRKSDAFINETVDHRVHINEDGSIDVKLTIVRKNIEDWTWPNFTNFDYLRVYVPEGSELTKVDGFANPNGIIKDGEEIVYDENSGESGLASTEVYDEHGKTVFANWIVTKPYEASTVRYEYRLPYKVGGWFEGNKYNLYLQKQPGRENVGYNLTVMSDQIMTSVNKDMQIDSNGLKYASDLKTDEEFQIAVGKS